MENAVEALKMAGSVLLFVMALSIAMLSFTQARSAIDTLVEYSDREYISPDNREYLTPDGELLVNNYYYLSDSRSTERYVGMETIIPTIYRVLDESYRIIFKFPDDYYLYIDKTQNRKICEIDFTIDQNGISDRLNFLNSIVYNLPDKNGDNTNRINDSQSLHDYLIEKLKNNYKIKESLGTYYNEDRRTKKDIEANITEKLSEVSEVNKKEARVITYTFE